MSTDNTEVRRKQILVVGEPAIPKQLLERLISLDFDPPGASVPLHDVRDRLVSGDVWLILADPKTLDLMQPDALGAPLGSPPLVVIGDSSLRPFEGPLPHYLMCRPQADQSALDVLITDLRGLWAMRGHELVSLACEELARSGPGPLAPRIRGVIRNVAVALDARELTIYACEGQAGPIFPKIASLQGEPNDLPLEVRIGVEDPGRILASRSPGSVGEDLLFPLLSGDVVMGLIWLKPITEGAVALRRLRTTASRLLGLALESRQIRTCAPTGAFNVDPDKLMFVEKLSSLGQLAAGIAHEINNPLFVITGNLEMAISQVEEGPRALLARAVKAAERIRRIVYDMRQFFIPASHASQIAELDLSDLVANAIQIVSLQPQFRNIGFVRDTDPCLPSVMGDDNQLLQVLTNIFLNAGQAMPRGGLITVRVRSQNDQVVITVSDTGVGIAAANLPKVFDPFFTTKQDWFGTGLGLSVCFTIVKNHGGVIEVESEEGKGATFTIRLPAVQTVARMPQGQVDRSKATKKERRILVADDEESVRDYLQMLLTVEGYTVDVAQDGASMFYMLSGQSYGVVVLDHMIAGFKTLETYREIREKFPLVRVILLTGTVDTEPLQLKTHGFFEVLTKPCHGEEVLRVVADALES